MASEASKHHHQCECCDKTFKQAGRRNTHEMTNIGEKHYKCHYCEKTFIREDTKKNHEMTHTGENVTNVSIVGRALSTLLTGSS